ncbi:MAG: nucleotidyl transferase AbiEii/AbiGii toxin family protein [Candidatus Omnitrophica bacterium]|nr:nucleotidyl transferase AbiEii/AbiGii toxin family protein [Candidatus Omnitrophota bacterium]MCK5491790.1 nucleotidyl transferase AbiEii/AbiGii toxin family protein [Candidatus Omnitrophota bacterium]
MNKEFYNTLQVRELFHLEFLRWLSRRLKSEFYALKGGTNLRFFFNSYRYSEDMDMDVHTISVEKLKDIVMKILNAKAFIDNLRVFNIAKIIPPNIEKAKQIQTTQRFKIHLITYSGEDLFTKVEFSRRGMKFEVSIQPISDTILRFYKLAPLVIPHYDIYSAVSQKINALASRTVTQARDIFDLFILSSQYAVLKGKQVQEIIQIDKAYENIFTISFEQFRDTVVSYLSAEDQAVYSNRSMWDEIKLKTARFLEEIKGFSYD